MSGLRWGVVFPQFFYRYTLLGTLSMRRIVENGTLEKYAAFTSTPDGGNPAGVWIGHALPDVPVMQRIASDVGFSETAFVAPTTGRRRTIRYYSPLAEVSFCGHATIATGVAMGEATGDGTYHLDSLVGDVAVAVRVKDGVREAALTSVEPTHKPASTDLINAAVACLGWERADISDDIPPALAYAGAWHLVLAVRQSTRLAQLAYDFDALKSLMLRENLTTLQLIWRESESLFHSRNPFPVGGVVEDPATGAAAAALGGYLRTVGIITPPKSITIRQGEAMGRPSLIKVEIPTTGGIVVSGSAIRI